MVVGASYRFGWLSIFGLDERREDKDSGGGDDDDGCCSGIRRLTHDGVACRKSEDSCGDGRVGIVEDSCTNSRWR